MIFEYIHLDGRREIVELGESVTTTAEWEYIQTSNKLAFINSFIPKFLSGEKIVLFDANHKQLLDFYNSNNINNFEDIQIVNKQARLLFFTSGSSGFPVGAFKSEENLLREVESLKKVVATRKIKKVVVTVPFVHIYGILAGLLLPMALGDVTLVVKEDFLPYELIEESRDDTLVITTPVFIKALAKLPIEISLSKTTFISSTAPLSLEDVTIFEKKYSSNVVQLFGSTETGGIAYKKGNRREWSALDGVTISTHQERLNVTSPFISPYLLREKIEKLEQPYQTEDIVEIKERTFVLIGRSNKLIKIAGKRISALQIETILEEIPEIDRAIVELVYKKELLRSEQIIITLEATKEVSKQHIKEKISQYYGIITIPFSLKFVEQINYSAMGKKVLFT